MKKILITGISGYIGSCLQLYLKKKFLISGIDKKKNKYCLINQCDLLKINNLKKILKKEKPDLIVHLAAQSLVDETINKNKYFSNNVVATKNLIHAMKKNDLKNLIFSSTAAVYNFNNKTLNEKSNGETVLNLINNKLVSSVHDISSGGLILALAEMCMASGYGLRIDRPSKLSNLMEYYFGEDQGRYLLEIDPKNLQKITKILVENNIFYEKIAITQKDNFEILGEFKINVNDLYKMNNTWYNNY